MIALVITALWHRLARPWRLKRAHSLEWES